VAGVGDAEGLGVGDNGTAGANGAATAGGAACGEADGSGFGVVCASTSGAASASSVAPTAIDANFIDDLHTKTPPVEGTIASGEVFGKLSKPDWNANALYQSA
jgi:hypothetical protein